MDDNNRALYDKIAYVNYLIGSFDGSVPQYSFQLKNSAEAIKVNRRCGWSALVCGISMLGMKLFRWDLFSVSGIILAALCFICAIFSFIYSACMEKAVIAEVDGDNITIKGRTYNCGEIDCIKGTVMNGLKIVSAGRDIVKFSKTLDNCGELIKWARCNHIKIDDDPDADPKKAQNIYMITAVIVMILAVFIGLYLGLKGR